MAARKGETVMLRRKREQTPAERKSTPDRCSSGGAGGATRPGDSHGERTGQTLRLPRYLAFLLRET